MKKTRYILLIICTFFCSCEKVLEFDIEDNERMIVVNALPCTDSTLFVNVTYSRFFLDNQPFDAVTNANISIDINGTIIQSSQRNGANYFFNYIVTAGDSLTMRVSVPGHTDIIGGTRVVALPDMLPPLAEIDTLQPISSGDITFTLNDPENIANYYYIYVLERDSGIKWNLWEKKWDTIDTIIHPYFNCLNTEITAPEVNAIEGLMNYFNGLLFTDQIINGLNYDTKLSIMMLKDTAEHPLMREYTLVVEALSPEAYLYMKDVLASQSIGSYFAEPTRIYSNLNCGYGIFASKARRVYPLTFTYKEATETTLRSVSMSRHKH